MLDFKKNNRCKYEHVLNQEDGFLEITDHADTNNNAMSVTNGLEDILLEISAELLVTRQYQMDPSKVVILNTNKTWDAVIWDFKKEKWIWVATEMSTKELAKLLAIKHISEEQCNFALALLKKKEDQVPVDIEQLILQALKKVKSGQ